MCPVCGRPMKKNGRTGAGSQRWKCAACVLSATAPRGDGRLESQLAEFLDWLLSGRCQWDMGGTSGRVFRKRVQWCWRVKPAIRVDGVTRHTVMADGTYMGHGWCLLIAVDGDSGEVLAFQWCSHESKAAYMALFSRIPAPGVLIADGLRGAEAACGRVWLGTGIQRCLVHVRRNTRADLTSRPKLQAGRELKKLSGMPASTKTAEQAVRWGEALNAWHERWKALIAERTFAKDDPANPKASRQQWWWTHEDLRRCYRRLEKLFREGKLFAWLEPGLAAAGPVARTTNLLEGGINSLIKRTLLEHRGLPEERMRRACEWRCYMKSPNPDPGSLIETAFGQTGVMRQHDDTGPGNATTPASKPTTTTTRPANRDPTSAKGHVH